MAPPLRTPSLQALVDATKDTTTAPRAVASKRTLTRETQPEARAVKSVARRAHSTPSEHTRIGQSAQLAVKMFDQIVTRMDAVGSNTTRVNRADYMFLMPNSSHSPQQLATFDALSRHPITVTNSELDKVIRLKRYGPDSAPTPPGTQFYIRSWELSAQQLRSIISEMTRFDECKIWANIMELHNLERYTIRYVGEVDGPRTPWHRFVEDLAHRIAGILPEFQQTLEQMFPEVANAAGCHLIRDATLSLPADLGLSRSNTDTRECVLIEYFDHPSLLNRQHGGFAADYVPSESDVRVFVDMQVQFYHKLHNGDSPVSNLKLTGADRYPFTNDLRDAMSRQAIPKLYRGAAVVLVVVGKDITLGNYLAEVTFFEGKSRAATLTRTLLRRMADREAEYTGSVLNWVPEMFDVNNFPFVDLYYWMKHGNREHAMKFLKAYFSITRPLIAATMSREVNGLTRANFLNTNGIKMASFSTFVAVPTLQYYDNSFAETYDEDSAFINMPQWHPGIDKYVSFQLEVRRLLDLSWQATAFLAQIVMDLIDEFLRASGKLPSRRDICELAIEKFESLTPSMELFKNLSEVKRDLNVKLGESRAQFSDDVRPILDNQGRVRIAVLGQALGTPLSTARDDQIEIFWEKNLRDLHLAIPRAEALKEDWFDQFRLLKQGQYFYLEVLQRLSPAQYTANLLRVVQPSWDFTWMAPTETKQAAILSCGLWFLKPSTDPEKSRAIYGQYPDDFAKAVDLQGRLIGVAQNGAAVVRWLQDDGTKTTVKFRTRPAVPGEDEETALRSIDFTADGIDILATNNEPFRTYFANTNTSEPATIPRDRLASTESGPVCLAMWKAVRVACGFTDVEDDQAGAREWKASAGVAGISSNANTEKPKQNRPPKEGDAIFPLKVWLDERFPTGGHLRTALKERVASSTDDVTHFVEFLEGSEWRNHPYVQTFWLARLKKAKRDVTALEKNIRILRSTEKVNTQHSFKKQPGQTGRGAQVKEMSIIVGAPGSAEIEPFAADEGKKKGGKSSKKAGDEDGDDDDEEEVDDMLAKPSKTKSDAKKAPKMTKRKSVDDSNDEYGDDLPLLSNKPSKKDPKKTKAAPKRLNKLFDVDEDDMLTAPKKAAKQKTKKVISSDDDADVGDDGGKLLSQKTSVKGPGKKDQMLGGKNNETSMGGRKRKHVGTEEIDSGGEELGVQSKKQKIDPKDKDSARPSAQPKSRRGGPRRGGSN